MKYSIYIFTHSFFTFDFPLIEICRIACTQTLHKWYNLFESLLLHFLIKEKALKRKLASYRTQAIDTFCHHKRHSKECLFFYIS
ncbi:hypothetical protein COL93_00045 [Bacillus toyonensis]|uniref:Uncharacterized protein n=1 Tax=Bacillus toyonensis TaxID=155322 RepID=A0A2C4R2P9_9BACI|nr:hypothetical protein COL93_00045 [Bacillus toyonensis]PHD70858.1 hypothetical protein COF40_10650 [Bacillus toyonensis]